MRQDFEHKLYFKFGVHMFIFIQAAVVGHFNFSNQNDNQLFKIFYKSALKSYHQSKLFFSIQSLNSFLNLSFKIEDIENPIKYAVVLKKSLCNQLFDFKSNSFSYPRMDKKIFMFSSFGLEQVSVLNLI